ncbi:hypothetical protein C8R45DRAFT_1100800 [Mycena sanguinolenta]|nr:hypothetical protein C8R45DRAFT_1100800 [Mycena sanguinolenta]
MLLSRHTDAHIVESANPPTPCVIESFLCTYHLHFHDLRARHGHERRTHMDLRAPDMCGRPRPPFSFVLPLARFASGLLLHVPRNLLALPRHRATPCNELSIDFQPSLYNKSRGAAGAASPTPRSPRFRASVNGRRTSRIARMICAPIPPHRVSFQSTRTLQSPENTDNTQLPHRGRRTDPNASHASSRGQNPALVPKLTSARGSVLEDTTRAAAALLSPRRVPPLPSPSRLPEPTALCLLFRRNAPPYDKRVAGPVTTAHWQLYASFPKRTQLALLGLALKAIAPEFRRARIPHFFSVRETAMQAWNAPYLTDACQRRRRVSRTDGPVRYAVASIHKLFIHLRPPALTGALSSLVLRSWLVSTRSTVALEYHIPTALMATRAPSQCNTIARLTRLIRPVVATQNAHPVNAPPSTLTSRYARAARHAYPHCAHPRRRSPPAHPFTPAPFVSSDRVKPGELALHCILRMLCPGRSARYENAACSAHKRSANRTTVWYRVEWQMHGDDPCLPRHPTRPARTGRPSHTNTPSPTPFAEGGLSHASDNMHANDNTPRHARARVANLAYLTRLPGGVTATLNAASTTHFLLGHHPPARAPFAWGVARVAPATSHAELGPGVDIDAPSLVLAPTLGPSKLLARRVLHGPAHQRQHFARERPRLIEDLSSVCENKVDLLYPLSLVPGPVSFVLLGGVRDVQYTSSNAARVLDT